MTSASHGAALRARLMRLQEIAGSISRFASITGLNRSTIRGWFNDVNMIPYRSSLEDVSEGMNVSLLWLETGQGEEEVELAKAKEVMQRKPTRYGADGKRSARVRDQEESSSVGQVARHYGAHPAASGAAPTHPRNVIHPTDDGGGGSDKPGEDGLLEMLRALPTRMIADAAVAIAVNTAIPAQDRVRLMTQHLREIQKRLS